MKKLAILTLSVFLALLIGYGGYRIYSLFDWNPMTLEEAKTQRFRISVEGIPFDVPVLYAHADYSYTKTWPRPPADQASGKARKEVDVIKVTALLPDLASYNETNASEFSVPGYGNKLDIYMTHYQLKWASYFENAYKRLVPLPESKDVPGMFHFRDGKQEVYMSHDKPTDEMIRIICDSPTFDPRLPVSPSCTVTSRYRDQFELDYTFSLLYLPQWREIDRKTRILLDSFIATAR